MSATVARLNIQLGANTAQLQRDFGKATQATQGFGASIGSVATAIAGIAGSLGIASKIKEFLGAFAVQEDAEAQLAQMIHTTGMAAGFTAEQLKAMASELQGVTKFGDEAYIAAQSLLGTFVNIKDDVFAEALEGAADMATRMKTDLQPAIIQIGKALNDPIKGLTALSRVGVSFTQQQKDMIRTLQESGDIIGAQRIILAELSKEFGGSARAAAMTFSGTMQQMWNVIGDVGEKIASVITPALKVMAGVVKSTAEGVLAWASNLDNASASTLRMVAVAITSAGVFASLIVTITAVVAAYKSLAIAQTIAQALSGPKGWAALVAGLAAAATAAVLVEAAFQHVGNEISVAAGQAKQAAADMQDLADGIDAVGESADAMGDRAAAMQEFDDIMKSIEERRKMSGDPKFGRKEEELARKNLQEQLATIALMEEAAAKNKAWMEEGAKLADQMRTPLEKYADTMNHLQELFQRAAISQEVFARASQQAADELTRSVEAEKEMQQLQRQQGVGAVTRFSTGGFSAVESARRQSIDQNAKQQVGLLKEQVELLKEGNELARERRQQQPLKVVKL